MVKVTVLVENTRLSKDLEARHGLSLAIETGSGLYILDTGPDAAFARNARRLGIDASRAKALVLSHAHTDHSGGTKAFRALSPAAPIYLFGDAASTCYAGRPGLFMVRAEPPFLSSGALGVERLAGSLRLSSDAWFLPIPVRRHPLPSLNGGQYLRRAGRYEPDDFSHEGVLVIDDGGGLVAFNSCTHSGLENTVESVEAAFPGRGLRAYLGGLHFHSRWSGRNESPERVRDTAAYARSKGFRLYTGHCTGRACVDLLARDLGTGMERLATGARLEV